MKKIVLYLLAGTVACLVVATVISKSRLPLGINVSVVNNSGQKLKQVVVIYTGGATRVIELPAGARKSVEIKPTGESHLTLTIHPESGAVQHRSVDIYFEPDYRGNIEINVAADFTVQAVHDTRGY